MRSKSLQAAKDPAKPDVGVFWFEKPVGGTRKHCKASRRLSLFRDAQNVPRETFPAGESHADRAGFRLGYRSSSAVLPLSLGGHCAHRLHHWGDTCHGIRLVELAFVDLTLVHDVFERFTHTRVLRGEPVPRRAGHEGVGQVRGQPSGSCPRPPGKPSIGRSVGAVSPVLL